MGLLATAVFLIAPVNPNIQARHEGVQQTQIVRPLADERVPLSIWSASSGDVTHLQSSLACAQRVGAFERTDLNTFDNYGFDVGCGYSTDTAVVSLFFNRRATTSASDDFEGAKNAIMLRFPGAKIAPPPVSQPSGMAFSSASFESSSGIREGVWVADVSGWTLTLRATYKQSHEQEVIDLLSALAAKTTTSAAPHLSACSGASPVERKGTEIRDKDRVMTLSLIASVSEAVGTDKARSPVSETWCAESPAGDEQIPMLYWRNIAMTENAGHADRLSLMTMDAPPFLLVSGNPTAGLVDDESSKSGSAVFQLTAKEGKMINVYSFFSGRPSLQVINPIGKDIFIGKRTPVTSFDPGSNTITIGL